MIDGGFQYHWLTSYERGRMTPHRLDWARQPAFFKEYPGAEIFPLARPENLPETSLAELYRSRPRLDSHSVLDFSLLSRLLILGAVITARSRFAEGEIFYRSHPSAGALYPVEVYLAWPGGGGLPAGIFHYDIRRPALELIRPGCVPELTGPEGLPTLVLSTVFARSSWKYRDRAYRYLLLDCGHLLENFCLGCRALGIAGKVEADFDDRIVNQALGLGGRGEAALALVRLAGAEIPPAGKAAAVSAGSAVVESGSGAGDSGPEYPLPGEVHRATSVPLGQASDGKMSPATDSGSGGEILSLSGSRPEPVCDYPEALRRRRSRRNFTPRPGVLGSGAAGEILEILQALWPELDSPRPDLTIAATGIDGLADGFYGYDVVRGEFVRRAGEPDGGVIGRACLDQRWAGLAAMKYLFWADLETQVAVYGPRAYRTLNLAAGRAAQALYLAAESLGFGACGVGAYYDRELAWAFSLDEHCAPLYLVAAGPLASSR